MYFQDECELDEELPSVSGILGKKTVIDLSDESADQLEPVFPVIPPTSFYSSQSSVLEEFRNIREEQDAEYNAMLENDLALENVCVHVYVIMGIVANKQYLEWCKCGYIDSFHKEFINL